MLISISGTPGTGKTAVAKQLSKLLKAKIIDLKQLSKQLPCEYDKKRKTLVVDQKDLQQAVNLRIKSKKLPTVILMEGHLSHLLKSDMFIVLRTNPAVLEKRLKKRKWSEEKIKENIKAEILDTITIETIEKNGKKALAEIDTTSKSIKEIAKLIHALLKNPKERVKYLPGKIDWSEKYKRLLIE